MHPSVSIPLVFIGCCTNVVFLEYLVKEFPGSGNIVTFSQFLFIAIEGFIFTTKFGTIKPIIPISVYVIMVSMYFVVQVTNTYALGFNISMPLHMIFRSGSLIANLVLGVIILKKRYTASKYLSVIMITAGIVLCTIFSAGEKATAKEGEPALDDHAEFVKWSIGISILTFALFMSARMGIYQEEIYAKYGKHSDESLFYNHVLPLPGFLVLSTDICHHASLFNQSDPVEIPVVGLVVPIMWLFLVANVLTQYVCIKSVFSLTTQCTSLAVTLVVTLRKFTSLLFSVWYFNNPFTEYHWLGAGLVFLGTLLFTEVFSKIAASFVPAEGTKVKKQ